MTLNELRRHFPHTDHTIYLNHAATAPLSRPVVQALERYIEERHLHNIENYESFKHVIWATRQRLARLIGTEAARVEFMPNTSYGLNVLANGLNWNRGDRIAIPGCEFPANVYPFLNLAGRGVEVDFIPHRAGTFTLDDVASTLTPRTRVLSVSWVQFLSGFRVNLQALGTLCRERGVLLCVDAIQGLGAFRLDVEACGIDFLACGGHKWLMATQGTGFLYVSEALQEQLTPAAGWLHGPIEWERLFEYRLEFYPDAERFRLGTLNHLGIAALHAALGLYEEAGPAWCEAQVLSRSTELAEGLDRLGYRRFGTRDPEHASGIVSIHHPDPEGLYEYLKDRGIVASVRNRLVRFAPAYYNAPEEMSATIDAVGAYRQGRTSVTRA